MKLFTHLPIWVGVYTVLTGDAVATGKGNKLVQLCKFCTFYMKSTMASLHGKQLVRKYFHFVTSRP